MRRGSLVGIALVALPLLVRCSGGGGGTATLKGNAAFRAAAIASDQSLGAGIAYPYVALQIVSPDGSGALGAGSPLAAFPSWLDGLVAAPAAPQLVPALNLYASTATFSANTATIDFYSDSAGTQSAGAVTITLPAGSMGDPDGGVTYPSYPDQAQISVDITGGNLPSKGNIVVKFTDSSGANTMTGSLVIKSATTLTLDLTLSPSLDVGGTITIAQNGETTTCSHVTGALTGTIDCDVAIAPLGWTGTGTMNLLTGQLTLNLNTGSGTSSASVDSAGHLSLGYGDGTTESIGDPFNAPLVVPSSGGPDGGHDAGTTVPCTTASGASGSLDACFGTGGTVISDLGGIGEDSDIYGVAIQPDGKIVAVGRRYVGQNEVALVRYASNGSMDTTFGTAGVGPAMVGVTANALVIQADGKITAVGNAYIVTSSGINQQVMTLLRFNADGSSDATFGAGGALNAPFTAWANGTAVALQSDGKIVAAGATNDGTSNVFAVARFNADGSIDTTFNTTGTASAAAGTGSVSTTGVAIQPDGKIVLVGELVNANQYLFELVRFNADGSLDTSFGSAGSVTPALGTGNSGAGAVAIQPDGKIVAVGYSSSGTQAVPVVVRYGADGSLDTTFNATGIATASLGVSATGDAVAIQADGKIVIAGTTTPTATSETQFGVARFTPSGSLDTTFDATGTVSTKLGYSDRAFAVAIQPDGKIVAAGADYTGNHDTFALARYWP